jgi:hypothetical protein
VKKDRAARRRLALAAVVVLPSAILCAAATWVGARYRMEPPAPLSADARAAAMAVLRASLDGRPAGRPRHAELERELADGGPAVVSVWHKGKRAARVEGRGARAADALAAAARALAESPDLAEMTPADRKAARIQVDLVTARAPILSDVPGLELFALHGGREGLGAVTAGPEEHLLLPDELVQARLLVSHRPIRSIPDLRVGIDLDKAGDRMAKNDRITSRAWDQLARTYFRFRSLTFV